MSAALVVGGEGSPFCGLLGTHPSMVRLYDSMRRAAALDAPLIVCGPTGSGKELVARALHDLGPQRSGAFCAVNVAALPEALVESELFGSARGAFTGAVADRCGLVEAAAGGTLFLDEAGDLPVHAQPKLLRVLEHGETRRVGDTVTAVRRFRLVAAVQQDPAQLRSGGRWRDDFYFRMTGVVLRVPALSERRSDIPQLAEAFLEARRLPRIAAEAVAVLIEQPWEGNVRELQQTLVRAAFHCANGLITREAVRAALEDGGRYHGVSEVATLQAARCRHVREVVRSCEGDTQRAASLLGISRSQVYRILAPEAESGPRADSH